MKATDQKPRKAETREELVREVATQAADALQTLADSGTPISPAQVRAIAWKIRRDLRDI